MLTQKVMISFLDFVLLLSCDSLDLKEGVAQVFPLMVNVCNNTNCVGFKAPPPPVSSYYVLNQLVCVFYQHVTQLV